MSTDKNVLVECSECGKKIEGVWSMEIHINQDHGDIYDPLEASSYARYWADDAYEREEKQEMKLTLRHREKQ